MKKLIYLAVILTTLIGIDKKALAASRPVNVKLAIDTPRKKIVHPATAMADADVTVILNAMRGKRNDEEKIGALKDGLKDKGITVDGLIKLLNQFLTDDAKLTGAEYGFAYTTNYKSFLKIMDLFSQEKYKYTLEDFYDKNRK